MANKTTKREVINAMLAEEVIIANDTYKAYLEHELELLDKKAANKKPSKTQEENVEIKAEIVSVLSEEKATVSELMTKSDILKGLSNQKISALLRQLVEEGKAVKTIDKKKSYFTIA